MTLSNEIFATPSPQKSIPTRKGERRSRRKPIDSQGIEAALNAMAAGCNNKETAARADANPNTVAAVRAGTQKGMTAKQKKRAKQIRLDKKAGNLATVRVIDAAKTTRDDAVKTVLNARQKALAPVPDESAGEDAWDLINKHQMRQAQTISDLIQMVKSHQI